MKATLPRLLGSLLQPGRGWTLSCGEYSTFLFEWEVKRKTVTRNENSVSVSQTSPHTSCCLLWLLYSFTSVGRQPSFQMTYNLQNCSHKKEREENMNILLCSLVSFWLNEDFVINMRVQLSQKREKKKPPRAKNQRM